MKIEDIIILGDSVMERVSHRDTNVKPLCFMIEESLGLPISAYTHVGFTPNVFYHMIKVLIRYCSRKPKVLVLPINLRCFSPQWFYNPDYQFQGFIEELDSHDGRNVMMMPYPAPDEPTVAETVEYHQIAVNAPESLGTVGQYQALAGSTVATLEQMKYRTAHIFAYHYLCSWNEAHPHMVTLEKIVHLMNDWGVGLYFYLTPINVGAPAAGGGTYHWGPMFAEAIREQSNRIHAVLGATLRDYIIDDFSSAVPTLGFFHKDETSEHLNQQGRQFIADKVARRIKELFL
jgi:hypothetical protein